MRKRRFCLASMTAIVVAMAAPLASAAGLGSGGGRRSRPVAGLRGAGAAGARRTPGAGVRERRGHDRRASPAAVAGAHRVEAQGAGSARIRILTLQAMDEPVIGHPAQCRLPGARCRATTWCWPIRPTMAMTAAVVSAAGLRARAGRRRQGRGGTAVSAPAEARCADCRQRRRGHRPCGAGSTFAAAACAPRSAAAAPPARCARHGAAGAPRPAAPRCTADPGDDAAARASRGGGRAAARLQLDVAEPTPSAEAAAVELALQAVAEAASAARASAAAASATAARIADARTHRGATGQRSPVQPRGGGAVARAVWRGPRRRPLDWCR